MKFLKFPKENAILGLALGPSVWWGHSGTAFSSCFPASGMDVAERSVAKLCPWMKVNPSSWWNQHC